MVGTLALSAFLLVMVVNAGSTQAVTGELEGWVESEQGSALPGVQVTVSGSSLQGSRDVVSDSRGYFHFSALPVGPYHVGVRLIGYLPIDYDEIRVRLAATTSLGRVRFEPVAVDLPEIIVSRTSAAIDPTTTATRTNLPTEALADLPLDRNFRSIVSLAPQANTSYYGDEVNIAGSTGLENVYYLDGINVTDPSNGATSTNLPYNFVKEIEVRTGGYEAEYGRALGGVVNVVTPSGGNEFRGQVYTFFTSDELRAGPRLGLADVNPTSFSSYDIGGSFGGPIARDRLWFYAAYNPTFDHRHVSFPGLSPRSASGTQHLLAGKLTWEAGPNTVLIFTVLGDPTKQERLGPLVVIFGTPASVANPEVIEGRLTQGGINFSLQARHQLGPRVLLQGSASRFNRHDDNEPRTAFGLTEPLFRDLTTGVWSGGYAGATRIRSSRNGGQFSATLNFAPHTVKIGAEYEDNLSAINFQRGAGGGGGGIITRSINSIGAPTYVWFEFYSDGRLHNRIPALYAQDSWQLTQRLRLNAGLRWSIQRLTSPDSGYVASITDGVQPRFGLIYQPGTLGSQKLFGSFGRFSEQLPLWLAQNFGPGRGRSRRFSQDPRIDTTGAIVLFEFDNSSSIEEISSATDVMGETFDEFTVGYERRVGRNLKLGVRGMHRSLRWAIDDGFSPMDGLFHFGNPGRGSLRNTPRFTRRYTALELTLQPFGSDAFPFLLSYVLSRNYGNYTGLFSTDVSAPAPNFGPQGDYPEQLDNGTGLLPNDRTHVLKLFGSYRFNFGVAAGISFLWGSGTPLSEYGGIPAGSPYWSFVQPRGSLGRTPALWDLNLRFAYDLPAIGRGRPRALLDLLHVGSPNRAVTFDQVHYTSVDSSGNQTDANATYGQVTHYQPPMSARLALIVDF